MWDPAPYPTIVEDRDELRMNLRGAEALYRAFLSEFLRILLVKLSEKGRRRLRRSPMGRRKFLFGRLCADLAIKCGLCRHLDETTRHLLNRPADGLQAASILALSSSKPARP